MTGRLFARQRAISCLRELSRYLRAGILPVELIIDYEIAVTAYAIAARELGGGDA